MKHFTIALGPGVDSFDLPAGLYGLHVRPTLEPKQRTTNAYVQTYQGRPGAFPLTITTLAGSGDPLELRTAGGYYSETAMPALRVAAEYGAGTSYSVWLATAPGERYEPSPVPRLGCWDVGKVFLANAEDDGTSFEAFPGVQAFTIFLGDEPGSGWGGGTWPADLVLLERLIDSRDADAVGTVWWTKVAEIPAATRVLTFEPPMPGLYRLKVGVESFATFTAIVQASIDVA